MFNLPTENFPFVTIHSGSCLSARPVNLPIRFALPPGFLFGVAFDVLRHLFHLLDSSMQQFSPTCLFFQRRAKKGRRGEQKKRTHQQFAGNFFSSLLLHQLGYPCFNDSIRHGDHFVNDFISPSLGNFWNSLSLQFFGAVTSWQSFLSAPHSLAQPTKRAAATRRRMFSINALNTAALSDANESKHSRTPV